MVFRRQGMRRRSFSGRRARVEREWLPLQGVAFTAVTSTSAVSLYGLQAPTVTIGTDLTADPPEDVTIMRVVSEFSFLMSSSATATWILGLIVQDRTWTPGATFAVDADKRFLWYRTFRISPATIAGFVSLEWMPGLITLDATTDTVVSDHPSRTTIDITPRVKLEAGKALHLVAYEESGTATVTVQLLTMRLLLQKSGRR